MRNLKGSLRPRSHAGRIFSIAFAVLFAGAADAQVSGYLNKASLGYEVPPPPKAAADVDMDLGLVRALRATPGSLEEDAAIGDAQAYFAPDIIVRFADAARLPLNAKTRPILTYMLGVRCLKWPSTPSIGKRRIPALGPMSRVRRFSPAIPDI